MGFDRSGLFELLFTGGLNVNGSIDEQRNGWLGGGGVLNYAWFYGKTVDDRCMNR